MTKLIAMLSLAIGLLAGTAALAQSTAWVQIEARPTLREAQERARAYANAFVEVNGFRLRSGWYAIALGPYTPEGAEVKLRSLRNDRLIPGDSFLADGRQFSQQFWPVGATALTPAPIVPTPLAPLDTAQPRIIEQADETPAEARRNERLLDRDARMELQEALQWEGFYDAAIDGAFGPGTRRSMADYQTAQGYEVTGLLTTRQRTKLLESYRAVFAALGMQEIEDTKAGIRIAMPAKMTQFDRYESPFAHYDSIGDSGVQVHLISQQGDQTTLFGLYDVMQTLEIVPLDGFRERGKNSFVLTGQSDRLHSYTYAAVANGAVKGFTLVWPPEDEKRMNRVALMMRDSFAPQEGAVLDDTLAAPTEDQRIDLLSGLDIRRPDRALSGFYVDAAGTVLTATGDLAQCRRVTIGDDYEAEIAAQDTGLGLTVLRPKQSLAPPAFAAFQTGVPRLKSDVAVAGFSYGDVLDQPVMTYGTLADLRGLTGEETVQRLALSALPGDAGGPVFDQTGAVMGMLLTRTEGARKLPDDVSFAAKVPAIAEFLSAHGVSVAASDGAPRMAPEDLALLAADMTVLVSCWN